MNNRRDDLPNTTVLMNANGSGRSSWDERGNSVWEWQTAPGVYSRNADTQRVRVLQLSDLKLLETNEVGQEHIFCERVSRRDV